MFVTNNTAQKYYKKIYKKSTHGIIISHKKEAQHER